MRAVKSTIVMCGKLKCELGDSYHEDQITLRALCDVDMPEVLKDDLPLFEIIMTDFILHMVRFGRKKSKQLSMAVDNNLMWSHLRVLDCYLH
eukprot:1380184-Amphidinium_carterae.2